jgi:catalase
MRVDGNSGSDPNYHPNSFDDIRPDPQYKETPMQLESSVADWYDRNGANDDDHFTQPGLLFNKAMNDYDRHNLVSNIVGAMSGITGPNKDLIVNRQLCHFFRADLKLGTAVAKGLGVNVDDVLKELKHEPVKI